MFLMITRRKDEADGFKLKAMQADDDSEENAYMDESVKTALKKEECDETNSIIPKFISGEEVKLASLMSVVAHITGLWNVLTIQ